MSVSISTFNSETFFKFWAFKAFSKISEVKLSANDRLKARVAAVAFGILTLGIGTWICRTCLYERKIVRQTHLMNAPRPLAPPPLAKELLDALEIEDTQEQNTKLIEIKNRFSSSEEFYKFIAEKCKIKDIHLLTDFYKQCDFLFYQTFFLELFRHPDEKKRKEAFICFWNIACEDLDFLEYFIAKFSEEEFRQMVQSLLEHPSFNRSRILDHCIHYSKGFLPVIKREEIVKNVLWSFCMQHSCRFSLMEIELLLSKAIEGGIKDITALLKKLNDFESFCLLLDCMYKGKLLDAISIQDLNQLLVLHCEPHQMPTILNISFNKDIIEVESLYRIIFSCSDEKKWKFAILTFLNQFAVSEYLNNFIVFNWEKNIISLCFNREKFFFLMKSLLKLSLYKRASAYLQEWIRLAVADESLLSIPEGIKILKDLIFPDMKAWAIDINSKRYVPPFRYRQVIKEQSIFSPKSILNDILEDFRKPAVQAINEEGDLLIPDETMQLILDSIGHLDSIKAFLLTSKKHYKKLFPLFSGMIKEETLKLIPLMRQANKKNISSFLGIDELENLLYAIPSHSYSPGAWIRLKNALELAIFEAIMTKESFIFADQKIVELNDFIKKLAR